MSRRPVHDLLDELFALDALGALDEDDRRSLREALVGHDPECAECTRLRTAHAEVAALLALSLEPVSMSAGAEGRLLEATRRVAPSGSMTRLGEGRREPDRNAARRRSPMQVAAMALAAAACLLGAAVLGYAVHGPTASPAAVAAAFAAQGGTHSATLQSGSKHVTVYYRPGQQAALLVGTGLPEPPAGHVYELWYLPAGETAMAPGGIFTPQDGTVVAPATVATPFTTLAVSIEPGYETAPTGKVVLSATT